MRAFSAPRHATTDTSQDMGTAPGFPDASARRTAWAVRSAPWSAAFALLFVFVTFPGVASGQVKPSQSGTVSQHVASTVVTIGYDRPVARGRTIFGDEGMVEPGEYWTAGANRPTWIEFSEPVTFEGIDLEAGRYGLWTVPGDDGPWEVILVSDWDRHHGVFPAESEVLRVSVLPTTGSHMETLAFYFPEVEGYDATLVMHWGELVLPLEIRAKRDSE